VILTVDGNLPRLRALVREPKSIKPTPIVLVPFPITDPRQFWGLYSMAKKEAITVRLTLF
jgi:hypothetical protein